MKREIICHEGTIDILRKDDDRLKERVAKFREALIEIGGPQEWPNLLESERVGELDYYDGFRRAEIAKQALAADDAMAMNE